MCQPLVIGRGCRGGREIWWASWCIFFDCPCIGRILVGGFVHMCGGVLTISNWRWGRGLVDC